MTMRSLLFVPGNRPERFAKAVVSRADMVCIDLEDAVPPDQKAQARKDVFAWFLGVFIARCPLGVRINHPATPEGEADLAALAAFTAQRAEAMRSEDLEGCVPVSFVMVPKVAGPDDLAQLQTFRLIPIIESAVGVRHAWDIAAAPRVKAVLFGGADYAADVGCTMEWEALAYARGALAAAAGAAQVELLDVPHLDVKDAEGLRASTLRAKALGFTGRACIHPDQVDGVNAAFTPTAEEVARAERVIAALDDANGGAALLDGKLIELPVIRAARRVLARAGGA